MPVGRRFLETLAHYLPVEHKRNVLITMTARLMQPALPIVSRSEHGTTVPKLLRAGATRTASPHSIAGERIADVVLVDPSDEQYSVGFNILSAHSDLEKNLLASDLVSVFQRLSTSWGDQMGSVLQNAILAFLESSKGGTLSDMRRFLVDASYRAEFLKTVADPDVVFYWQKTFPQLSGSRCKTQMPGGGIEGYVRNLDAYGNQTFSIASLRAWNAWWIMQQASGGQFLADTATLFGPITGRTMAFALAALGELVVFLAVLQSPTRRNLALGVATSVLVCFSLLTAMHERYAFGALVFLTLGFAEPRIRAIWLVFNVVFMANLLAATPASTAIADILPEGGPVSIVGSLAILVLTAASLWVLVHPLHTSAGSAVARHAA